MKPMACQIPWTYIFNELSYPNKYQEMTKMHLSQGRSINGTNGTLPKANLTLEHYGTLLKI